MRELHAVLQEWQRRPDEAGPSFDTVAGPWSGEIVAAGKTSFGCGMDTFGFEDGKLTEYWTLSKESEAIDRWTQRLR